MICLHKSLICLNGEHCPEKDLHLQERSFVQAFCQILRLLRFQLNETSFPFEVKSKASEHLFLKGELEFPPELFEREHNWNGSYQVIVGQKKFVSIIEALRSVRRVWNPERMLITFYEIPLDDPPKLDPEDSWSRMVVSDLLEEAEYQRQLKWMTRFTDTYMDLSPVTLREACMICQHEQCTPDEISRFVKRSIEIAQKEGVALISLEGESECLVNLEDSSSPHSQIVTRALHEVFDGHSPEQAKESVERARLCLRLAEADEGSSGTQVT